MILIKNITIVTQNKEREIVKKGSLVIEKEYIKVIGKSKSIEKEYSRKAKKVIDGKNKVIMPGLINSHGHLAMTLLRGYADDMDLEKWWLEYVYPVESKFTRKKVYQGSLLAMIEMIKSGTTCFIDFYYYEDEVAWAAKKLNMRGFLGCAILDFPTFLYKNADEALEITKKVIKKFSNNSLLKVILAPHMFQTTSLETYVKVWELTKQYGLLLTTHMSETKAEVNFSIKKYKKRPVEVLSQASILDENVILAHCCWVNKKEINLLKKSNVSIVHCPVSNMKLASGIMPLPELLRSKINVSLGTDGACSNNNLDMFEEMKTTALIHKVNKLNPTIIDAQTVLDMATINGAKTLKIEDQIGSIEIGKRADLIIINFEKPHLIPCHNIISHLVYSVSGSDVETTIINGKIVMENRKIKNIDEDKFLQEMMLI
ncbi:amidohydrolase [Patescibacteria group bacterium]|nr:amidohydrolase [Patescibacteria group bacterium]MBU1563662.1 amidohydrolase [Patescibacteria group bacterium]